MAFSNSMVIIKLSGFDLTPRFNPNCKMAILAANSLQKYSRGRYSAPSSSISESTPSLEISQIENCKLVM